jgi:hypothetical protein
MKFMLLFLPPFLGPQYGPPISPVDLGQSEAEFRKIVVTGLMEWGSKMSDLVGHYVVAALGGD